ncbi:MAG TPA: MBL fold metallo-hydrolase [Opitutaceae bacterium]|nr:MBL fold metallo-hydrolase [Opitutaceae bacterium]
MRLPLSDHCNGSRFFYPGLAPGRGFRDFLRWRLTRKPAKWPERVPIRPAAPPPAPDAGVSATWIGHSTFLLRTAGASWLTDPVFSETVGPSRMLGLRRTVAPALPLASLPRIEGVLLSHDHYDHCDLPSLRALAAPGTAVVAPLNYGFLRAAGAAAELVELDWWQACEPGPQFHLRLVPAQHWCRRLPFGTNLRLWGGFFLRAGGRSVYFAGDTGYDPQLFAEIRRRCGSPDLALLPIGAYEPRWFMRDAHMNPAEAVQAHRDLGARRSAAMHWGTFGLADEPREAPVRELEAAREAAGIPAAEFRILSFGETILI